MAKNSGKWAAGALVAGAVGYAIGVLTAPKSGKETRKDIQLATNKAKTELEKKLKYLLANLNNAILEAKKITKNVQGKTKSELTRTISEAVIAKEKVRLILSAIHDGEVEDQDLKTAHDEAKQALKALEKFIKK
jgi:gas vesicle protein